MHKMYNKVHYVKIISLPTEMAGRLIIQDSLLAYLLVDEYFMTLAVCIHDDVAACFRCALFIIEAQSVESACTVGVCSIQRNLCLDPGLNQNLTLCENRASNEENHDKKSCNLLHIALTHSTYNP